MKLRDLAYLCDPDMEIKIVVQKSPVITTIQNPTANLY